MTVEERYLHDPMFHTLVFFLSRTGYTFDTVMEAFEMAIKVNKEARLEELKALAADSSTNKAMPKCQCDSCKDIDNFIA